ncbi:delta9-fatty acid desaturase [Sistotremastrum suecicum HHB10207 ss-3]|uniref:Acyl-CoA desaturase n=1 Tax=Sistotremastrum suecicum HHB10207 ss-3 TaxID=1314776 RepID=A0A166GSV6_9AGAM|nr:delta9-fatty acid desaturase [Sistotremastrum suecicum HHB10207 ss-3]
MSTKQSQLPTSPQTLFSRIRWFNLAVLSLTPSFGVYGACTRPLVWQTLILAISYYFLTLLGITAGYHRLWSHRSYKASIPLQYFLAICGAGAVQGSIRWWAKGHRSHHRYTDTELDPYSALNGILYCHIGWQLVKPRVKPGHADTIDLSNDAVVQWQHQNYFVLVLIFGYILPAIIGGVFWGDAWGAFYYAGLVRMTVVHHCTFAVNSLAHAFGDAPFDDKHTPRDHVLTALLTLGEGYHNFHHEFPMDYRNAIKWYQYDPTKWFIYGCQLFGLASQLRLFPDNEIKKGELNMQLKKLKTTQDSLVWPASPEDLPIVDWETFQRESKERHLIVVSGFIHDIADFVENHPGGRALIVSQIGKDATAAFFGGVYDHSNAAHNLLSMRRVGVLHGGVEIAKIEPTIPSLRVVQLDVST